MYTHWKKEGDGWVGTFGRLVLVHGNYQLIIPERLSILMPSQMGWYIEAMQEANEIMKTHS